MKHLPILVSNSDTFSLFPHAYTLVTIYTLSVVFRERLVHQANEMSRSFITHLKRGEDTVQALICYLRQAALKGGRVCSVCSQTMLHLTFQMWERKDTTTDSLNRKHKEMSHNDLARSSVPHL